MKTRTRIIGIAGPSGAGKTTVAAKIADYYQPQCLIISADNYYKDLSHLTLAERAQLNFDHPDRIDFDLLVTHLECLKHGETVDAPVYDFKTHTRDKDKSLKLNPAPFVFVEGILVFHEERLRNLFDIRIFVKTDLDLCLMRRIKRDMVERGRTLESVLEQYEKTVRPMYKEFIEPTARMANMVVRNNENNPDLDVRDLVFGYLDSVLTSNSKSSERVKLTLFSANGTARTHSSEMESSKSFFSHHAVSKRN